MASPGILSGEAAAQSEEGLEWQVRLNGEAIIETTRVVIFEIIFVQRPGEFAADLPDERLEAILQAIFLHLPQYADFLRIGTEIRPDIMVERDHHFGVQCFRHAQHIGAGHLVSNTARVLAVGAQRHINLMFVTVLRIVIRVVRVTAVVEGTARVLNR